MEENAVQSSPAQVEKQGSVKIKRPVLNILAVGIVFLVIGVVLGYFLLPQLTGTGAAVLPGLQPTSGNNAAVGEKVIKYLNDNFFAKQGLAAKLVSINEKYGLYDISFDVLKGTEKQGSLEVFVSRDAKTLFVTQQVLDLDTSIPAEEPTAPVDVQKSDKPKVELFVMSFCPYGVVAEKAMSPVVALLKGNADISVHFIATASGDTPESVQSLHGAPEAMEDLRQLCIAKNYGNLALWKYLDKFNAACTTNYSDATVLDACWKKAAQDSNIDTAKIDSCSKSKEAVDLLKADEALANTYSVSGSPTIVVNGTVVNPARTAEDYKQSVCSAFNTEPSECSQVLSSTSANVSGSCG